MKSISAIVKIFGREIGKVIHNNSGIYFEFDKEFLKNPYNIFPGYQTPSPVLLKAKPELLKTVFFQGLHGPLADSLPGKFGNELQTKFYQSKGIDIKKVSPVEKLLYVGETGPGAMEFYPTTRPANHEEHVLELRELVEQSRSVIQGSIDANKIKEIIEVGASSGGARAKALIGLNGDNSRILAGARNLPSGYEHYLIKFDGIDVNNKGWGAIEYSFSEMAKKSGVEMSETSMLQLDNLSHFVTKRFDRIANKKIHMLSLSAITESDPDNQRSFDYDLLLRITKNICLDYKSVEDQFRRMIFNLLSVNQDDHTRNFSFLMGENNKWQLSPAYDLSFAHSGWCSEHQLLFNGKLGSEVTFHDLEKIGRNHGIKNTKDIIDQVIDGVETFYQLAHKNGVPEDKIHIINQALQNREASVTLKGNVKLKQVQKENQLDAPQVDSLNQSVTTLIPKYER